MSSQHKHHREGGFSMAEMLVALGCMLVIGAASLALIGSSVKFANSTYNLVDAEQSLRNAHEVINRDLTNAGDGLRGIGTITAPLAFVQFYITRTPVTCNDANFPCVGIVTSDDSIPAATAIPQSNPAANFQANSDRISMLIRDSGFNNGNSVSLFAGKLAVVGTSTVMTVGTTEIGLFQVGEIYALTSQSSAAFGLVSAIDAANKKVTLTNGDSYGLNQNSGTSSISQVATFVSNLNTSPVAVMRLQIIQYYVTSSGLLMRRVIGVKGTGFRDTVVAEHVSNLQFRYLTNLTDSNGNTIQPMGVLSSSAEQNAVREIETTIGLETVGKINAVTNANASTTTCGANTNGKQNICSTTHTTVRNLQFRQAIGP
jgi:type II secretory pathway pseudopilin PulG